MKASFWNNEVYHFVEKPPHTVTNFDLLKLNTINNNIGIYRNAKPKVNEVILNQLKRLIFIVLAPLTLFPAFSETAQLAQLIALIG